MAKDVPAAAANIELTWARISATGMRASNEDALGQAQQDDMSCFVMSDGAGGHLAGEVASRIVVEAVLKQFLKESSFGPRALLAYVASAIDEVAYNKKLVARQSDMSATFAALLVDQSNRLALWGHLGDTRVYWFRKRRLHEVTKDHSVAQQFIDAGFARADQLRLHPQRNVLYAAVGAEGETQAQIVEEVVRIEDGDAFLICTDGLWEWVMEADIERTLAAAESCEQWLDAMTAIAEANVVAANKVWDNHTAFAIWVHEPVEAH